MKKTLATIPTNTGGTPPLTASAPASACSTTGRGITNTESLTDRPPCTVLDGRTVSSRVLRGDLGPIFISIRLFGKFTNFHDEEYLVDAILSRLTIDELLTNLECFFMLQSTSNPQHSHLKDERGERIRTHLYAFSRRRAHYMDTSDEGEEAAEEGTDEGMEHSNDERDRTMKGMHSVGRARAVGLEAVRFIAEALQSPALEVLAFNARPFYYLASRVLGTSELTVNNVVDVSTEHFLFLLDSGTGNSPSTTSKQGFSDVCQKALPELRLQDDEPQPLAPPAAQGGAGVGTVQGLNDETAFLKQGAAAVMQDTKRGFLLHEHFHSRLSRYNLLGVLAREVQTEFLCTVFTYQGFLVDLKGFQQQEIAIERELNSCIERLNELIAQRAKAIGREKEYREAEGSWRLLREWEDVATDRTVVISFIVQQLEYNVDPIIAADVERAPTAGIAKTIGTGTDTYAPQVAVDGGATTGKGTGTLKPKPSLSEVLKALEFLGAMTAADNTSEDEGVQVAVATALAGQFRQLDQLIREMHFAENFHRSSILHRGCAVTVELLVPVSVSGADPSDEGLVRGATLTPQECAYEYEYCRIHPSYQSRHVTGRIFSSAPNLQAFPKESRLRLSLVAPAGYVLASFDYAQIELRVLAVASNDSALQSLFQEEGDAFSALYRLLFKATESPTPSQRATLKVVVYGLIYGMGPQNLREHLKALHNRDGKGEGAAPVPSPEEFRNMFISAFPEVDEYLHEVEAGAQHNRTIATLGGRSRGWPRKPLGEADPIRRQALSTAIQGTAADLLKCTLWRLHCLEQRYRKTAAALPFVTLLPVHDEIIMAVKEGPHRNKLLKALQRCIEYRDDLPFKFAVPLRTKVRVGQSLGSLEQVDLSNL